MKRTIGIWQLWGFAVTSLFGTLLHFLYDWLDKAVFVAPFSGVNESTWEHMKLLFWPMLIFAVIESFFARERKDFWCIKLRGILVGLALIPVLFYTYNGVIGKSPDWINIAIFFISAAAAYLYEARLFKKDTPSLTFRFWAPLSNKKVPIFALATIALLFVIFTFAPPPLGIFKDPLTGTYGI